MLHQLFLKACHHLLGVCHAHTGLIRLAAVRENLYGSIFGVDKTVGKLGSEHHHKVYLAFAEHLRGFLLALYLSFAYKIVVGIEALSDWIGIDVMAAVEHCHADVFYLVLNDIARQKHHYLGHYQQNQQRARVAEYMYELLSDEA